MNEAELLAALPQWAFSLALVLSRCGVAIMLIPGLGEAEPPPMVRAGFALGTAFLLLPIVADRIPVPPAGGFEYARLVVIELLVGGMLGWLARLPSLALSMGGAIMSYMMGLSSVVQQDPALGGQSAALSRLLGLVAPVLVLSTGLYALPLQALAGSYSLFPPGSAMPMDVMADSVTGAVAASVLLAFRVAAPLILAGVLVQAALGVLARLAPQLQLYSAATAGQIVGGLILLGVVLGTTIGTWSEAVQDAWSALPGL